MFCPLHCLVIQTVWFPQLSKFSGPSALWSPAHVRRLRRFSQSNTISQSGGGRGVPIHYNITQGGQVSHGTPNLSYVINGPLTSQNWDVRGKITFRLLSWRRQPSQLLPPRPLSLLTPVQGGIVNPNTGATFVGDKCVRGRVSSIFEKKRISQIKVNFILEQTGSGPKSRSPSVPLSPISIPLAISSTLALAAPTFPFTLSASWLRERADLQKLSRAKTLI